MNSFAALLISQLCYYHYRRRLHQHIVHPPLVAYDSSLITHHSGLTTHHGHHLTIRYLCNVQIKNLKKAKLELKICGTDGMYEDVEESEWNEDFTTDHPYKLSFAMIGDVLSCSLYDADNYKTGERMLHKVIHHPTTPPPTRHQPATNPPSTHHQPTNPPPTHQLTNLIHIQRKYNIDGRTQFPVHRDTSAATVNILISDPGTLK